MEMSWNTSTFCAGYILFLFYHLLKKHQLINQRYWKQLFITIIFFSFFTRVFFYRKNGTWQSVSLKKKKKPDTNNVKPTKPKMAEVWLGELPQQTSTPLTVFLFSLVRCSLSSGNGPNFRSAQGTQSLPETPPCPSISSSSLFLRSEIRRNSEMTAADRAMQTTKSNNVTVLYNVDGEL